MNHHRIRRLRSGIGALLCSVTLLLGSLSPAVPVRAEDAGNASDTVSASEEKPIVIQQGESGTTLPAGPEVEAESAILMDADTGAILYQKDAQSSHYPASITKILTTLLALENSSPDEIVTFSEAAIEQERHGASHIARDIGEQMTMEQCLYAVMLASANECAYAVAEHVGQSKGGDYQTFIDMMNERARELGCVNTHFTNSNGMHDPNHWTCAYDMALIAQAAYANPKFMEIIGTKHYDIPPTNLHAETTPLNNKHDMYNFYHTSRYLYDGCLGGKTGYTTEARGTLVTYCQRNGVTLAAVVLGCDNYGKFRDTIAMMDYGFNNYCTLNAAQSDVIQTTAKKAIADLPKSDELQMDQSASIIMPDGVDAKDLTCQLKILDDPEKNEDGTASVAKLEYLYGGTCLGHVDLKYTGTGTWTDDASGVKQAAQKKESGFPAARVAALSLVAVIALCAVGYINALRRRRIRRHHHRR